VLDELAKGDFQNQSTAQSELIMKNDIQTENDSNQEGLVAPDFPRRNHRAYRIAAINKIGPVGSGVVLAHLHA